MAIKQQLHQRQVQKLILAPALQQAIKLLPLTNLELIEIIDTELSENPMLEVEEETIEEKTDKDKQNEREEKEIRLEGNPETLDKEGEVESQNTEDGEDIEAYFQQYFDDGFRSHHLETRAAPPLENVASRSISLWDHLNWQADLTFTDEKEKEIAQYIIGNINEDGYLIVSLEEITATLETSLEEVERIREKIKKFDPVGVACLSLKETLLAQMDYFEIIDTTTRAIVEDYIHLLEKSDFSQISKQLGVSIPELKTHMEIIKGLDPAPGSKYSQERTSYIVPDIVIKKEDGEYKIFLNDEGVPRLKINSFYRNMLSQKLSENKDARQFLNDKMKKAFWFLRSLDQRNKTIFKVAKYILERQEDFLDKGIDHIKPLTLIELAQELGVHESTVGRVVANKYMMTPRGVFSLKYFFHKSLSGDFGEEVSSLRVKDQLKKLVESEDQEHPLSDIEIEEILARENFHIARRTVAKYRKQLKIEPSHIRKRKYWMEESK
ncbi:MAG: RNA polymerase factor sigma-54 [Candidatus Aminicenantes bacterium]|nr:RNA polymerase factor sigma-54 [Candidatus Aminicenantes bacterium]